MNETFIILFSWTIHLSGYPVAMMPDVQFKPHSFFVENACLGRECKVEGWYNDKYIVYIDEKHSDLNGFSSSLVVHEFTHYLQHLNGMTDSCERERQAYNVQNEYIREVLATVYSIPRRGCYESSYGN